MHAACSLFDDLREALQTFRAIVRCSMDADVMLDSQVQFLDLPKSLKLLLHRRDEITGISFLDLLSVDNAAHQFCILAQRSNKQATCGKQVAPVARLGLRRASGRLARRDIYMAIFLTPLSPCNASCLSRPACSCKVGPSFSLGPSASASSSRSSRKDPPNSLTSCRADRVVRCQSQKGQDAVYTIRRRRTGQGEGGRAGQQSGGQGRVGSAGGSQLFPNCARRCGARYRYSIRRTRLRPPDAHARERLLRFLCCCAPCASWSCACCASRAAPPALPAPVLRLLRSLRLLRLHVLRRLRSQRLLRFLCSLRLLRSRAASPAAPPAPAALPRAACGCCTSYAPCGCCASRASCAPCACCAPCCVSCAPCA